MVYARTARWINVRLWSLTQCTRSCGINYTTQVLVVVLGDAYYDKLCYGLWIELLLNAFSEMCSSCLPPGYFTLSIGLQFVPLLRRISKVHYQLNERLVETEALYRLEAHQRRLAYNTVIELRGNIRVFCRIRPVRLDSRENCWLQANENHELVAVSTQGGKRKFQFDHVFHVESSQDKVSKHFIEI